MFFFSVIGAIQMRYDDDDDDEAEYILWRSYCNGTVMLYLNWGSAFAAKTILTTIADVNIICEGTIVWYLSGGLKTDSL